MLRFVCCVDLVLRPMVGIDVERNGDQFYYVDFPDLYEKWLSRGLFSISVNENRGLVFNKCN